MKWLLAWWSCKVEVTGEAGVTLKKHGNPGQKRVEMPTKHMIAFAYGFCNTFFNKHGHGGCSVRVGPLMDPITVCVLYFLDGNDCVINEKRQVEGEVKTLAPFLLCHTETVMEVMPMLKWKVNTLVGYSSFNLWSKSCGWRGFLKLFDQPTSNSDGVYWPGKSSLNWN